MPVTGQAPRPRSWEDPAVEGGESAADAGGRGDPARGVVGATRLEILVTDVENPPSATSLEWIDNTSTGGWTPCPTHDASTMSASPSRTSTR